MYYSKLSSILTGLTAPSWVVAFDTCNDAPGAVNGQCVTFYHDAGCLREEQIANFKPNVCDGECIAIPVGGGFESFDSISVVGDGTFGVNCIVYSDSNCQNEMSDTGNVVAVPAACKPFPDAQSVKCFFKC